MVIHIGIIFSLCLIIIKENQKRIHYGSGERFPVMAAVNHLIKSIKPGDLVRWVGYFSGDGISIPEWSAAIQLNHFAIVVKVSAAEREERKKTHNNEYYAEVIYINTIGVEDIQRPAGKIVKWYFRDYKRRRLKDQKKQNWYWEKVQ
jgi:DNA replicative helicase MCM subunit Mcm2 (Cdc46/Mcm family)